MKLLLGMTAVLAVGVALLLIGASMHTQKCPELTEKTINTMSQECFDKNVQQLQDTINEGLRKR